MTDIKIFSKTKTCNILYRKLNNDEYLEIDIDGYHHLTVCNEELQQLIVVLRQAAMSKGETEPFKSGLSKAIHKNLYDTFKAEGYQERDAQIAKLIRHRIKNHEQYLLYSENKAHIIKGLREALAFVDPKPRGYPIDD